MPTARVVALLTLLAAGLLQGCHAPLARSSFEAISPDGIEGTWRATPVQPPDSDALELVAYLNIERIPLGHGQSVFETIANMRVDEQRPRYSVVITTPQYESVEVSLEGEFLDTSVGLLFTFQGTLGITGWPWNALVTPLQRTVLLEFDAGAERFRLKGHEASLVWTPIRILDAGGRLDEPPRGMSLVSDFDSLVRFYSASDSADWHEFVTVERLPVTGPAPAR